LVFHLRGVEAIEELLLILKGVSVAINLSVEVRHGGK